MNVLEEIQKRASRDLKRIVFPEATDSRVLNAAATCQQNHLVTPVLVGNRDDILTRAKADNIDIHDIQIVDVNTDVDVGCYTKTYYELRKHKGMDLDTAKQVISNPLYFAAMMVRMGRADASVAGSVETTGEVLRAAIQIIGVAKGYSVVSSSFLMVLQDGRPLTYGDCGVVPNPSADQLADIAIASADSHQKLTDQEPVVALLSFSTRGSAKHELVEKVQEATKIAQQKRPDLRLDGELQADAALVPQIGQKKAPDSKVAGHANVLIFPDLQAGNIAYKLTERLAGAEAVGPLLQGLDKPANDLSRGCKAEDIVNVACICSLKV